MSDEDQDTLNFEKEMPVTEAKTRHRRNDPPTSKKAAEKFTDKRLSDCQKAVLHWFLFHVDGTDEEIEKALWSRYPVYSTVRHRRTDLVKFGYLEDTGKERKNSTGSDMTVWRITKKGRDYFGV